MSLNKPRVKLKERINLALVSNLARLIAEKRVEGQPGIAQPPPSSTVTGANATKSRRPESPQVANTV